MSAQALATALGPPLMLHSASCAPNEEIDHAQPIAVLKYLLQIWPQPASANSVSGNVCYYIKFLVVEVKIITSMRFFRQAYIGTTASSEQERMEAKHSNCKRPNNHW
jgi:hypothetical protein